MPMLEVWQALLAQFAAQSAWEITAVVLALAYVWLAARQNIWCWPAALISTGIYSWLFWEVTLPFNAGLNAYYMAMAVYGWWQWQKPEKHKRVTLLPLNRHLLAILGLSLLSLALAMLAAPFFDSQYLYLDAFVTVFSLFTTILVAHKVLENWLYWMVINCFAAYLYFSNGLYLTALLFVLYFGFAIYGYIQWRRSDKQPADKLDLAEQS